MYIDTGGLLVGCESPGHLDYNELPQAHTNGVY